MKVSVIIAAYNIEKYIKRCIKSIKNQTFKEIEIIVVNDGSTDNTLNIINEVLEEDIRIKVINQKNKGLIETRKVGLGFATGEYILFVDGDDWLEYNTVEMLYDRAISTKSDIILYNCNKVSENLNKDHLDMFNLHKINDILQDPLKELFLGNIQPSIWSKFIKFDFIKKNNIKLPSSISFAEDLASVANMLIHKPRINFVYHSLYNYYIRNDSMTRKIDNRILEINRAISFIELQLKQNNLYNLYNKEFEYLIFMHLFFYRQYNFYDRSIHKELYILYKNYNIKEKNNIYITDFCKKNKIANLLVFSYSRGYFFGRIIYIVINIIKYIIFIGR